MKDSFSLRPLLCQFALGVCFWYGVPAAAVDWTIADLGTLGGTHSHADGINARGQVVGSSYTRGDNTYHAFLHDGTTIRDLSTLGGIASRASGINARGQVVGVSNSGDTAVNAFLLDGTTVRYLTLGGTQSQATGINANGQVVGWGFVSGDTTVHAFLFDGAMRDLGTLGGISSGASGINASGQVVGWNHTVDDTGYHYYRACLFDGAVCNLGTLGGTQSQATGINARGRVVGFSDTSDGLFHAFLHDGTTMRDLGTLGGESFAYGINARGQVVGSSGTGGNGSHAFLHDGVMRSLSTLPEVVAAGWQSLDYGGAINDSGQIVGGGEIGGQTHAFRLHPQTTSRYMRTVDSISHFILGCAQTNQSGLLILDFGQPWVRNGIYGTIFPGTRRFASIADIENAVRFFLNGYYGCRGTGSMTVAVGTNNFGINTTYAHGQAWGRMVARLNNYISRPTADLRNRLAVVGASDIEMDWSPPGRSRRWVDGYASTSPVMYYNYGDAAGCPRCNNGWDLEAVWYVSWGNAARPLPVPQIYHTGGAQTRHWQAVTTYGRTTHGTEAFIPAALTQWQACLDLDRDPNIPTRRRCHPSIRNTPVQAWYQLINMLHGVVGDPTRVQNILYSSDITWQN